MDAINRQADNTQHNRSAAMTNEDATSPLSFTPLPYLVRPKSNRAPNNKKRHIKPFALTRLTIDVNFDLSLSHLVAGLSALLHRYNQASRQHLSIFTKTLSIEEKTFSDGTEVLSTSSSNRIDALENKQFVTLTLETLSDTSVTQLQEQSRKSLRKRWPRMQAIDLQGTENEFRTDKSSFSETLANVGIALYEGIPPQQLTMPHGVDWVFLKPETTDNQRQIIFFARSDLFHSDTLLHVPFHLNRILAASQPSRPSVVLSELPMLSSKEKSTLLMKACHATPRLNTPSLQIHESLPDEPDIASHFSKVVQDRGRAPAIVFGDEIVSFESLDQQSTQLAHLLHQKYLVELPADSKRVAVLLAPHPEVLITLLAILKCGATYIPIDVEFPIDRTRTMLELSGAQVMVSRTEYLQQPTTDCPVIFLDRLNGEAQAASDVTLPTAQANDLCYIFFTSGTTGTPKGVKGSYHNLTFYLQSAIQAFEMDSSTQMPVVARFTFSISLFELLAPLMAGGAVRMLNREDVLHVPSLAKVLSHVSMAHIGPSLLNALVSFLRSETTEETFTFPNLKHLSSGGDLVAPTLIDHLKHAFPQSDLFVVYGCSEIACMGCFYPIERKATLHRHLVGKGFNQTDVRILDKAGNLLPPYCRGEIYIASPGVTLGYLNLPELTKERYIEKDGKRFYRTGDIGQWLFDGNIEFFGRQDYQVQIKGVRVELAEVEANLKTLNNVKEAAAALQTLPDQPEPILVGFIVAKSTGSELCISRLREELLQKIPDYLVPSRFVELEKLPLNINMKVDRRALPIANADICLPSNQPENLPDEKLPKTLEDIRLLFNQITGRELTQSDIHTDFSLLGVNSLMLMSFRIALEKQFGIALLLPQLKSSHGSLLSIAQNLESLPKAAPIETDKTIHLSEGFFNRYQAQAQIEERKLAFGDIFIGFNPQGVPGWYSKNKHGQWLELTTKQFSEDKIQTAKINFSPTGIDQNLAMLAPMSSEQMEIWVACQQSELANAGYNLSFALSFNQPLVEGTLKQALVQLANQNPTLRTQIIEAAHSIGIQQNLPLETIFIAVDDQSLPTNACIEQATGDLDHDFFTRAFDLTGNGLWRCGWDKTQPNQLWFCFHHLVMDGWSINLFFEQLVDCYQNLVLDSELVLNGNGDWWQFKCDVHQETGKAEALNFWEQEYQEALEPLDLPTRWPRGSKRTYNAEYIAMPLTDTASNESGINKSLLEKTAASLNVSPFALCYSAFVSLIHRLSGQEAFSIGVPLAGQPLLGFPEIMTHAVRTLPLKHVMPQGSLTEIDGDSSINDRDKITALPLTIGQWIKKVALQLDEAYKHGQCSFGELLGTLKLSRDTSRPPLVSVIFTQTPDQPEYQKNGLSCQARSVPRNQETFDAWFNVLFNKESIFFESQFNSDLFSNHLVHSWMLLYKEYLSFFIHQTNKEYSGLPSLSQHDLKTINHWNNTQETFSAPKTIPELLARQVARIPSSTAFVFNDESLTFREFNEKTNQLAHWLQREGVAKGNAVGVYAERSMEMLLAIYATIKLGALYVPLDPQLPTERLQYIIKNSEIKTVFSHHSLSDQLIGEHPELTIFNISQKENWSNLCAQSPQVAISPNDSAYIIYTSGSTGRPKGVVNAHQGITNRLLWQLEAHQLSPNDRILYKTPFNFDVSLWEIFCPILNGSQLIIAPPESHKDPDALEELMIKHGITMMHFVPSMLSIFLKRPISIMPARLPLRAVLCSGEALSPDLQQDFFKRFPKVALHNLYGPTEAAVEVSHWECSNNPDCKVTPIGKPIANTQLHVVDKYLNPQPIGVAGELLIGGIQVAEGYANQAELTAEKFLPDPFNKTPDFFRKTDDKLLENNIFSKEVEKSITASNYIAPRIYRTGDLAKWNHEGEIEYLGRLDFQVKIRGLRIEIGEIETLLNLQKAIKQAVVVVKTGADKQPILIAYCTRDFSAANASNEEVKREIQYSLSQSLPSYMMPQVFQFIDAMPLSASGKADRKQLMAMDIKLEAATKTTGDSAKTETEQFLSELWQKLLGTEQKPSRTAEFNELGGHSLLAIQMMSQIKTKYGVKLNFAQITSTLCEMAENIDRNCHAQHLQTESTHLPPSIALPNFVSCALAPEQESVVLAALQSPEASAGYNLSNCFDIKGMLNTEALEKSLQTLVDRHQALRTYIDTNSLQYQIINQVPIHLPVQTLDNTTSTASQAIELDALCLKHASEPFNFSDKQPLTRYSLIKISNTHHLLLTTLHHAIADGWSKKVFWEELAALYNEGGDIKTANLPEPSSLTGYNALRKLQEKALTPAIDFWQEQLSSDLDALEFPLHKKTSSEKAFSARKTIKQFDQPLTHALQKTAKKLGHTLFNITITAYAVLVSRMTQTSEFAIGVPFAGQPIEGMDCLIGQCARVLPVILNIDESLSFIDQVNLTAQKIGQVYEHSGITFAELSELADVNNAQLAGNVFSLDQANDTIEFNELEVTRSENPVRFSVFDLGLTITASSDKIILEWIFNTQKYDEHNVQHWLRLYEQLISSLITKPEQPQTKAYWLPTEDLRQIEALNQTQKTDQDFRFIEDIFYWSKQTPNAVALQDATQQVTYSELLNNVQSLAKAIQTYRLPEQSRIAVCMTRTAWVPQITLAIWLAGGIYLPLDPSLPVERQKEVIMDAEVSLVFVDQSDGIPDDDLTEQHPSSVFLEWLSDQATPIVTPFKMLNKKAGVKTLSPVISSSSMVPSSLAYLIFTSGSTGKPKGVAVSHENLWNILSYLKPFANLNQGDSGLAVANFCFDPHLFELFIPLLSGAKCVITPKHIIQNGIALGEWINHHNIAFMQATPIIWRLLAENNWQPNNPLKAAITGGEALSADIAPIVCEWARHFYNAYGPTETTILSTLTLFNINQPSIIGKPVANTEAIIIDKNNQPLPIGCAGELWIGGKGVAQGYWRKGEITKQVFIERNQKRWYRTGDKARLLPSNELEFLGRMDRQIKLRGFRIEPSEIEHCLLRHEAIEQTCVVLHTGIKATQSRKSSQPSSTKLVAFVRTTKGYTVNAAALKSHVSQFLPSYLIPQHFEKIDAFPISNNGKVNRKELSNYKLSVGKISRSKKTVFVSETEELLTGIWKSVLSLDQIDRHDDFFLIGGHSLSAVKVLTQINNQLGINLSINVFLQNHTLKDLAKLIDSHPEAANQSNAVVLRQGTSTPLFCLYGVLLYKDLANALPENQTVIGVYLKEEMDLLKNEDADTFLRDYGDINTIAEKYMQTIKSVQPEGPYYISGESFGGVVALEVAQQLRALGDEVALVAMMDSWLPGKAKQRSLLSHALKHLELAWKDKNYLYQSLLKAKSQLINGASNSMTQLKNTIKPFTPFSLKIGPEDQRSHLQMPHVDLRQQARNSLVKNYQAQKYDGVVVLLRAMERDPFENDDVYMGWSGLIPSINVVRVPGDHLGILQKPNVSIMAKHLSIYLPTDKS